MSLSDQSLDSMAGSEEGNWKKIRLKNVGMEWALGSHRGLEQGTPDQALTCRGTNLRNPAAGTEILSHRAKAPTKVESPQTESGNFKSPRESQ